MTATSAHTSIALSCADIVVLTVALSVTPAHTLAVDPCWLKDADGEPVKWPLFELIQAGWLELPRRRNGSKRELDSGTSINIYRSVRPAIESIDGSGGS